VCDLEAKLKIAVGFLDESLNGYDQHSGVCNKIISGRPEQVNCDCGADNWTVKREEFLEKLKQQAGGE